MGKYSVVAIERQYSSGGHEVGKLVAQMLNVPFYDREIVEMAAEKMNMSISEIERFEESVVNPFHRSISSYLRHKDELDMYEKVFAAESEIIKDIVKKGSCVIVGRCASYILNNVVPTLKVYIYASKESRITRAMEIDGVPFDDVENRLKQYDKKRADYFNVNTRKNWSAMDTYDICLNNSSMGVVKCAKTIYDIMKASENK